MNQLRLPGLVSAHHDRHGHPPARRSGFSPFRSLSQPLAHRSSSSLLGITPRFLASRAPARHATSNRAPSGPGCFQIFVSASFTSSYPPRRPRKRTGGTARQDRGDRSSRAGCPSARPRQSRSVRQHPRYGDNPASEVTLGPWNASFSRRSKSSLGTPSSFHPPDHHQKIGITFSNINQGRVLQQNRGVSGRRRGRLSSNYDVVYGSTT